VYNALEACSEHLEYSLWTHVCGRNDFGRRNYEKFKAAFEKEVKTPFQQNNANPEFLLN
jgi:hypothetical protein